MGGHQRLQLPHPSQAIRDPTGRQHWQLGGCERAFACGVTADRVVNARDTAGLLAWRRRG